MGKKHRFNFLYFIFAVWAVFIINNTWRSYNQVAYVPYNEFLGHLEAGKIENIQITDNHIKGTFKEPLAEKNGQGVVKEKEEFVTARVEPELVKELEKYNIKYERIIEDNFFTNLLAWIAPFLIFFALWWFIIRRMSSPDMGSGFMTLGKNKAKIYVEQDIKTRFDDVAGIDEAKEELREVVSFLKNPKQYGRLGAKIPKGILLVGPPGTGKTMLAKAVAGEAGVPFFSISGSEFVEMFVGLGAARVRDLFEQARKRAPCIIFIDELDALGKSRNSSMAGGHDEKEQTLNQLLVDMDGFDSNSGIVLLAATNRPEILDPALLRAGRFDRQVLIDRPDKNGRLHILRVHSKNIQLSPDLDLMRVAELTPGFSGADIANLVNEAAIVATRRNGDSVTLSDFTLALERIVAGLERRSRILSPQERRVVAYHEMGHALVAASLPGTDPVHKISIIPRGIGALGYTLQRPSDERHIITETELKNRLMVLLGGRAAELLIFKHLSTGAADDLSKATDIARNMVTRYGMNPKLGSVAYDEDRPTFLGKDEDNFFGSRWNHSDVTTREIDIAVKDLVENSLKNAVQLLEFHKDLLEKGAQELLKKETLEKDELEIFFSEIARPAAPFEPRVDVVPDGRQL
jgi:cell division protease FtsH